MLTDPFPIHTQTSEDDRAALIWIQDYVANRFGNYSYLEIGSYRGGTLAPHLLDDRCVAAYSIDKRVISQPDPRRGDGWTYKDNTTEHMVRRLLALDGVDMSKLLTFESDATDVEPNHIHDAPQLVLVDGEHTDVAVVSDWKFIEQVIPADAVVVFHDVELVARGIGEVQGRWNELDLLQRTLWSTPTIAAWHLIT